MKQQCEVGASEGQSTPSPGPDSPIVLDSTNPQSPLAHVVLYQPEIPQNTGNIGRTCVATGASLWVVRPAAFRLDDRSLRRAGLDYWQHLDFHCADNWQALREALPEAETGPETEIGPSVPARRRYWYFSRFAKRSLWTADFHRGDVLVFGSETSGLPESIHEQAGPCALRLPMAPEVRSLNLASTVAVALFEMVRQVQQRDC